ncbi:hypothetical protein [Spirosoma montaniterrae]|uniref:Uncharacterized protein n=1 Tax=Spirosoma montaniterrae TaxID=1178516 RepID=A0A1P9WU29_9BACT|nr:hypothetical protein [Spirosoma montaniterrae]AQG78882.1 hypothetical protein AWR27_05810 [Spirosoma montaniterrae]
MAVAKTNEWEVLMIGCQAAGAAPAAALARYMPLLEKARDALNLHELLMPGPAVDFQLCNFRRRDEGYRGISRMFVFAGVGIGIGMGANGSANYTDLRPFIQRPFNSDDLNYSMGAMANAGIGYVAGGSLSSIWAWNTGGNLFGTGLNRQQATGANGDVIVGAQATATIGIWIKVS